MSMETITIYEEGTGVHICIPNISVAEVKKMMAGTFISSITSGNNVKFEKIEAEELKMDEIISADESVQPENLDNSTTEAAAKQEETEQIKENVQASVEQSIQSDETPESEKISQPESTDEQTMTLADLETNPEDELPFPDKSEDNKPAVDTNSAAVINSAPEFEDLPFENIPDEFEDPDEDDTAETDTADNSSKASEETANNMASEEPVTPVSDSELIFKVLESKLNKPGIDKILSGFAAVVFMRVKPEISIKCNDTIVVNVSGLDESDVNYIKQVARATRNFEE